MQFNDSTFYIGEYVVFDSYTRNGVKKILEKNTECEVIDVNEDRYTLKCLTTGRIDVVMGTEIRKKSRILTEDALRSAMQDNETVKEVKKFFESNSTEESRKANLFNGESAIAKLIPESLIDSLENSDPVDVLYLYFRDKNFAEYRIGAVLSYIYLENIYETKYGYVGSDSFDRFLDEVINANDCGYGHVKCRMLMRIFVVFSNLGIREEELSHPKLGYNKLAIIMPYVNKDNVHQLINEAKNRKLGELRSHMKYLFEDSGQAVETSLAFSEINTVKGALRPDQLHKVKHVNIPLYEDDQYVLFMEAMQKVAQQYPEYKNKMGQLVTLMAQDFICSTVNEDELLTTKEDFLSYAEARFADYEVFFVNRHTGQAFNPRYDENQVSIRVDSANSIEVYEE